MSTNINKNAIKCVVFDLDGTLLNTLTTIKYYLNIALDMNGIPPITDEECRSYVGYGARWLIECALKRHNVYSDSMHAKVFTDYNGVYNADPYHLTEIYDGIEDAISVLHEQGITLAVLSNKPDFATREVVDRFFPNTFAVAGGAKDGLPLKPSPDTLFNMIGELGYTVEQCIYVGDSEVDVQTAKNANMSCISVSWGFRTIEQLKEAGALCIVNTTDDMLKIII